MMTNQNRREAEDAPAKQEDDHIEPEAVSRGTEKLRSSKVEIEVDIKKQNSVAAAEESEQGHFLRSPICCIMGHVDAGKTKLLDCIRGTNVQKGEAGGITQQIGATYLPAENIEERIKELKSDKHMKVPGLLLIDTPGHEPFTKLRSRGSSLCDIAVLVVDIMDGLKPQTIESLNLLKSRNTEFIVALNKVDRLSGWKACPNAPIVDAMKQQPKDVKNQFNDRVVQIVTQFKEQGINTKVNFDENKRMRDTYSIVPISAKSGEGIPNLLSLMVYWTQNSMTEKLTYSNEVQCRVLEVKHVEGIGTTIDIILVNGVLQRGDQIVVCGNHGTPIVARIQSLLTPEPMKELRVKGKYQHHSEIKAAQAIKITSPQGFEHAIAGTSLYVVGPGNDLEEVKEAAMEDMEDMMKLVLMNNDKSDSNHSSGGEGVCVQASTLVSLEAMLEFLKAQEVNTLVRGVGIGPIQKKDVRKASVMLEKKILAFDVKVTSEAQKLADELGVKIFVGDIIHEVIKAYMENLKEEKEMELAAVGEEAVFPCVLKILPDHIFRKKDPIIVGVKVLQGIVKVGTPLCVPQSDFVFIGRIESIKINERRVDSANKEEEVCIKIVGTNYQQQVMFGRHLNIEDELVSQISRRSIDVLKSGYRNVLLQELELVSTLKTIFKIL
ncbi:LOW QUALITY PROTEIN: uncharacterized protein LOC126792941 [Argentina anserina]|uniref:LOW QUALITY PROTEIN: uncharacterized protein LOC126792941 n=1 Tax=Argentina anserina TaxID=57926 RepID=UPI002176499C|nr:LOW QUALITY PROTEIN: uncharacterized protein LOC126792941 [Potentilla anserina]